MIALEYDPVERCGLLALSRIHYLLHYVLELFFVACEALSCVNHPEPLNRQTSQSHDEIKPLGIALSGDIVAVEDHTVVYIEDSVDRFAFCYKEPTGRTLYRDGS